MRNYPVAITFLIAYLFFNDGIQTVIFSSSTYGSEELGFGQTVLIGTILIVQFVAFGGALLFGRMAATYGAKRTILAGLVGWMLIVTVGAVPAGEADRAVLPARRRDRHRAGWHPGPLAVVLLAVHPARQGGRVLQLLSRCRPRHVVVRDPALRRGLPSDRLLSAGGLRADHLLRDRWPVPAKVDTAKGIRDAGNAQPAVI